MVLTVKITIFLLSFNTYHMCINVEKIRDGMQEVSNKNDNCIISIIFFHSKSRCSSYGN